MTSTRPPAASPRLYRLTALIQPAPDLPGCWVTHILDIDVVTYGTSFHHALAMGLDAAALVIADDLARGLDPLARGRAMLDP